MRGLVSIAVAIVPLCLPLAGGGSDDPTRARIALGGSALNVSVASRSTPRPAHWSTFHTPSAPGPSVRELVLSFDDGPDLEGTPEVMRALDSRGLKGIFFVNGRHMVGNHPQDLARRELVRTLVNHGHLVANHSFSHKNLCRQPEALAVEIDGNSEIIAQSTGIRPELFRAPYGARCAGLTRALDLRELTSVGWDLDPQDWNNGREASIVHYVTGRLQRLNKRAILLLHDTHPAAVRALPRILDWIDAENQRVAQEGGIAITVRDYAFFFPGRQLPETGLGPVLADLGNALTLLPGLNVAQEHLRLRSP